MNADTLAVAPDAFDLLPTSNHEPVHAIALLLELQQHSVAKGARSLAGQNGSPEQPACRLGQRCLRCHDWLFNSY